MLNAAFFAAGVEFGGNKGLLGLSRAFKAG